MTFVQANTEQAKKRGRPLKMKENKQAACNIPMKPESQKRKRVMNDDLYDNDKVKSAVMEQAKEIQANLAPEYPSMIKYLLQSHVTRGFWLGLSKKFCDKHLPKEDTMIVLADESGKHYQTKYLAQKVGLSAGWRRFSIAHNLLEGDAAVFQLVKPTKFTVYIVRVNGSDEVDGALGLLKLDAHTKQINPVNPVHAENLVIDGEEMEDKDLKPLLMDKPEENKNSMMNCGTNPWPLSDHSEIEVEDLGFAIFNGIRLSDAVTDFKDVKNFKEFDIVVNGLLIASEIPKHLQTKYYELCCSQKSFLHYHILKGLNCKLAAGIIAETINIADAIRASKLTTSLDNFATWEKSLKAFDALGMNVGFLLARLSHLMSLAAKSKKYKEARCERVNAEEEIRMLEAKLLEVKDTMNRLDSELKKWDAKHDNFELMFKEVATAPW